METLVHPSFGLAVIAKSHTSSSRGNLRVGCLEAVSFPLGEMIKLITRQF